MKREYVTSGVWCLIIMAGIVVVSLSTGGSWLAVTVVTAVGLLGSGLAGMEYLRGHREGMAQYNTLLEAQLAHWKMEDRLTDALTEWDAKS